MTQVSPSPERPLVEAVAELQDADPESLAALIGGVDDRVDDAVSTRSSHDDPDPQGRIGSNLDAAVSSRSSHEWDPDGVLPSGTTVASVDDIESAGGTSSDIRFSLTPERVPAADRSTFYNNFEPFAQSKTAMENIVYSATVMDEVSASATAMSAVSASATAMDEVSASATAMDEVSASATAMDEVSASATARDAICESDLAWDTVAAAAMPVGKYVAGSAGLTPSNFADIDAVISDSASMATVSGSAPAMDALSASTTAMEAVSASLSARSAVFESEHSVSSLWASTPGASIILENGTPTLPHDYGYMTARIEDGTDINLPGETKVALELDTYSANFGNTKRGPALELDLSNSATMEFQNRAEHTARSSETHGVMVDGTVVVENGGNYGWTKRSVDVSGYNGTHTVEFFSYEGYSNDSSYTGYFADLNLI